MSPTAITLTIVILIAIIAAIVVGIVGRRQALRRRFGEEYERLVGEHHDRGAAERELRERERRHREFDLRELSEAERERYTKAWDATQVRFAEEPTVAVSEADHLVTELMATRGYPTEGYDQQLADLSVEHAATLGHYRDAHDIFVRHQNRRATTEDLRQALVHYRTLFNDLLGGPPGDSAGTEIDSKTHDPARHNA